MKNIIIITITIAALTACNKQAPELAAPQNTINFTTEFTQDIGAVKGVAKEVFTLGDQFFVYGVNTENADFDPKAPNGTEYVFDAEPLAGIRVTNYGKNNEGNDVWQYGNPVVWMPGKSTFFAFSPAPYAGQNYGITQPSTKFALTTIPKIDFVVAGGYDPNTATPEEIATSRQQNKNQVDLMAAYAPSQTSGKLTILTFEHTLSRITFAVRPMQQAGFIRINSVTLKNVKTYASLRLAGGWDPATITRPRDFSLTLKNDVVNMIPATPDKTYAINEGEETLCMIPQPLAGVTLEIRYAHSPDGITWPDYQGGKLITIDLNTIASAWTPAALYNYILAIDPQQPHATFRK